MGAKKTSVLILLMIFCLVILDARKNSDLELISLDYPKELVILQNFENKIFPNIRIKLKYLGDKISANNDDIAKYSYSKVFSFCGETQLLRQDATVFNPSSKYLEEQQIGVFQKHEVGTSTYGLCELYKKNEISVVELRILPPKVKRYPRLYNALSSQKLSSITITLKNVKLDWELEDCFQGDKSRVRKGQVIVPINKTIIVSFRYTKNRPGT